MSDSPLDSAVRDFLSRPNPCVMATLTKDGAPVSVATWYRLDGDRIHLNLDAGRTRLRHLQADPRVALTMLGSDSWYTHASLRCRVDEIADDPDLSGIDALARHYTGKPYPVRHRDRVDVWLAVDKVHTWGELRDS